MLLAVENLFIKYGGVTALRGVSLHVNQGEAVSVLGPNGAGKTSLLRGLSGFVRPSAGSASFAGKPLSKSAYRVTRSGFVHVPEGRGIVGPLTVEENLQMGGYLLPSRDVRPRMEEMLRLFPALDRHLKDKAGLLSGGEQQMLAIARGLMSRPKLLAIDEPSMGLAPVVVADVLEALRAVVASGTSILLVEQNAALALDVADRAYVLVHGEVAAEGRSEEIGEDLLARYLT
jgi:branched-chain amino acid transport system ATP-binding protein